MENYNIIAFFIFLYNNIDIYLPIALDYLIEQCDFVMDNSELIESMLNFCENRLV